MIRKHATVVMLFAMSIVLLATALFFASNNTSQAITSTFVTFREATELDESDFKELIVVCPEGMKAISGGAGIFYGAEDSIYLRPVLISSFMYPDDKSWFAEAVQPEEAADDWLLEVHVSCIQE